MELSRGSMVFGIFFVVLVFVAVTSAQITFSRQWVRGKYPGDSDGGESPEFQRAAKAVFPKRTFPRYLKSDYVPILVNAHVLEEIYERSRELPLSPSAQLAFENVRK
ncbi:unnamed protein product [Orchesella dallaii]|uniref:Uncharacterized protein n=1 Tax=Orchesella dallaii TaxID=48710 RepID=A0ABP1RFT8_9HEXA